MQGAWFSCLRFTWVGCEGKVKVCLDHHVVDLEEELVVACRASLEKRAFFMDGWGRDLLWSERERGVGLASGCNVVVV